MASSDVPPPASAALRDDDDPPVATHLAPLQSSPTSLPDMGRQSASPGLTAAQPDVLSFGSSSLVWPSVSDSDDEGEGNQDASVAGSRVMYPEVCGDSDAESCRLAGMFFEDVKAGDKEREILEEDVGDCAPVEVYDVVEDALDEDVLEKLRTDSREQDRFLDEVGSMLSADEAKMLRPGAIHNSFEDESSSVTTSNVIVRDEVPGHTTQGLSDDWLGADDATSSLNTLGKETNDLEHDTLDSTSNSRGMGSKRVYTFPKRQDEVLAAAEEVGSQVLLWPVGIAIEIIGFQVKLILQTVYFSLWLCGFSISVITFPFRAAMKATSVTSATVVDMYTLATQVRPMVKENIAQAGPMLKQTTKRCGFGCLAAVYVMFMLGFLLVPAVLLDIIVMHGLVDEPVEFRQILHFDYREEHPSAVMSLLPPTILAKVKGDVYPNKVLRAHAIPPSHGVEVTIFLSLPESDYNQQLGMFQVSAELLTVRGQVLKRASWPCMLRFQSSPIRYAKHVILGVPLVMGLSKESQMLGLRLFENEKTLSAPVAMVRFVLEPRAGFPRGHGLPEVYSAEAQVQSVLPWTRDLLRRWKWTFYVWNALCIFMFEIMVVLCCCHQVLLPTRLLQAITEGFREPQVVSVRDTPSKRTSKSGRRVNFSDELPVARATLEPSKAREPQFSRPESTSSLTGPRLQRLPRQSSDSEDASSEATSSWIAPPLETLDYVGGMVEAAEESVKDLGETAVDGARRGVGAALHKVGKVLDQN
nr:hypothetical protein PHYPA_010972 [Physcomitrium patens]